MAAPARSPPGRGVTQVAFLIRGFGFELRSSAVDHLPIAQQASGSPRMTIAVIRSTVVGFLLGVVASGDPGPFVALIGGHRWWQ